MVLTDKAKKDFNTWRFEVFKDKRNYIARHNDRVIQSLILDWFDSVGFYPYVEYSNGTWYSYIGLINHIAQYDRGSFKNDFNTRQRAISEAIIQCNIIYNEKNRNIKTDV